jgi:hypothetical protein
MDYIMKYRISLIMFIYLFFMSSMLFSQESVEDNKDIEHNGNYAKTELKIDLPIFDLPYQIDIMNAVGYGFFNTYSSLSMNQSTAISTDIYSAMQYGLKKLNDSLDVPKAWKDIIYYSSTAAGILAFAYVLPFGYPWMKHEYTRSTLSRFGIDSFNGYYSFNQELYGVTGVTDNELSRFKAEAPYDFIRMNAASIESYYVFSDFIVRKYFFYEIDDLSFIPALITVFLNTNEMQLAFFHEQGFLNIDDKIREWLKNDKGQTERAIVGYSSSFNWVYELFRPNEPYANRGVHPSGDGSVARYITYVQLTDDERTYLIRQGWLSYLNLVSPLLYGFRIIPLGSSGLVGNFALRHYPTSFGTDTSVQVFLKKKPFNMAFTFHNNINYENWFPAIEAELVDYPLTIGKLETFLSPRLLIGMQPKDQVFKTDSPEFLGLFGLRIDFKVNKYIYPYFDFTAKTRGYVAGNEYLNANVSIALGVSLRF